MRIGAKISVFNVEMREARKRLSMTQKQLAEEIHETTVTVQFIETLKQPLISLHRIKGILQKISDVLDVDFDVLFPDDYLFALQNKYLPNKVELIICRDVDILSLPEGNEFLKLPAPDEAIEKKQMRERVNSMLDFLPEREKRVVVFIYGLHDGEGHTFEEAAKEFGVSRERVRQIEQSALSRLRHPSVRRQIEDFLR